MHVDHPFRVDARGRTAEADADDHLRDMIEQVLFTAPGERVNRPDFGCGLLQQVFAPNSDELAATMEFLVSGALSEWLGHLIEVEGVQVEADDARLRVSVAYSVRRDGRRRVAELQRGLAP